MSFYCRISVLASCSEIAPLGRSQILASSSAENAVSRSDGHDGERQHYLSSNTFIIYPHRRLFAMTRYGGKARDYLSYDGISKYDARYDWPRFHFCEIILGGTKYHRLPKRNDCCADRADASIHELFMIILNGSHSYDVSHRIFV